MDDFDDDDEKEKSPDSVTDEEEYVAKDEMPQDKGVAEESSV